MLKSWIPIYLWGFLWSSIPNCFNLVIIGQIIFYASEISFGISRPPKEAQRGALLEYQHYNLYQILLALVWWWLKCFCLLLGWIYNGHMLYMFHHSNCCGKILSVFIELWWQTPCHGIFLLTLYCCVLSEMYNWPLSKIE